MKGNEEEEEEEEEEDDEKAEGVTMVLPGVVKSEWRIKGRYGK